MKLRTIEMTLFLIFLSVIFLIGCQSKGKTVAIIKFTSHPALDELETGFITSLEKNIKSNPKLSGIKIERYNANANPKQAKELAEIVNRSDVKLILAIATPAAQAVSNTPSNIPLLYGAVADPDGAGIIPSQRATGIKNVSPKIIQKAIAFIKTAFPEAKRIGTLYNPGEQNSVYVQKIMKESCEASGLELIQLIVNDSSQVSSMAQSLILQKVDVIYSANDNTVNAAVASVVAVSKAKKIPFIIGDLSTLSKGALAAVGLEYSTMGESLAKIATEILHGKNISEFTPQDSPNPQIWVNTDTLQTLKLSLPDSAMKMVDYTSTK